MMYQWHFQFPAMILDDLYKINLHILLLMTYLWRNSDMLSPVPRQNSRQSQLTLYPLATFIAVGASWKWYQWVEGQNTRRFASWRFFDRTSYKPSSSPDEIVLHGRAPLSHVTPYRYFSNKMTPKDHLAAGPTAKVVVLKDLSNRTYPNLANLKLTFIETKK